MSLRRGRAPFLPIVFLTLWAAARAGAQEGTSPPTASDPMAQVMGLEKVFVGIAQRVEPGVVAIRRFVRDDAWFAAARGEQRTEAAWRQAAEEDLLYPGFRPTGGGSGFLVSPEGHILTLNQVVTDPATGKAAALLDVEIQGIHYPAEILAQEPTIDLAIVRIMVQKALPTPLALGNSGRVQTGQWALAFGNPVGPEKTLSLGLVAYEPSRDCYQDEMSATYLQTSNPVPTAALGGPLVNLQGEVIGINTRRTDSAASDSLVAAAGSGYALPINLATAIYQSLLFKKSTTSPWLGISVLLLTAEKRAELGDPRLNGILIDNVFDPSPASTAGIQVGDVLQSMNRQMILTVYDFQRWTYMFGIGANVELGIVRKGKPMVVKTVIAERPANATTR
jgi:S1-C subfamily serine protease